MGSEMSASSATDGKKRLGESLRLQISKVSELTELGPKFSGAISVDHLLSLILKQTLDLMSTDVCIIWLKDKTGHLIPRISFGLKTVAIQSTRVKLCSEMVQCIMERESPTNVYDLTKEPRLFIQKLIKKENLCSLLASPLVVGDERIGVLMIFSKTPRSFTEVDIKTFNALARQSALAIANIGLYEKMDKKVKAKVQEMSALFTMSRSLSSAIDLELLLGIILEKTKTLMKAKFCTLKILGKMRKRLNLVSSAGLDKKHKEELSKFEHDMYKRVARTKAPCVINHLEAYSKKKIPSYIKRRGIRSLLTIPLFSHKRRIGMLSVYIPEVRIFQKEDLEMFEMVASICSMAIDNAHMLERIRKDYLNTIKTLAKIIDANDTYTRGHCDKVMRYSLLICRKLRLPSEQVHTIKTASLLHDIGKIGIDLSIIRKPEKLTEDDWKKVRMHPEIGAKIVSQVGFLNEIVPIIRHHHARYSGGGYPDPARLNNKIPLGSRIIAVADAFDAMTSDRPYRKAMTKREALEELKRCAGEQFDPEIVDTFIAAHVKFRRVR